MKERILTICGTRPEFIRLSCIIPLLDTYSDHILVNTGQNYNPNLSDIFFKELKLRKPDYQFDMSTCTSLGEQVGVIFTNIEKVIKEQNPSKVLILGDTTTGLSAILASRMGLKVYHMEAGNRSFSKELPEEVNRRVIDHSSDILLPYTERAKENLLQEGIPLSRVFTTGNPIAQVIRYYGEEISSYIQDITVKTNSRPFFLVTFHRTENVDNPDRLRKFYQALDLVQKKYKQIVYVSTHPHTLKKLEEFKIEKTNENICFLEPMGYFKFVAMEKLATCILSDSGTVIEETAILNRPSISLRYCTERQEAVECGSTIPSGIEPEEILNSIDLVLNSGCNWEAPQEYLKTNVAETVVNIILSKL